MGEGWVGVAPPPALSGSPSPPRPKPLPIKGRGFSSAALAPNPPAMAEKLHILVTGTSRGIGEAILAALDGHRAIGHSTAGGGGRIAADLAQAGAAEGLWNEALERLEGRI